MNKFPFTEKGFRALQNSLYALNDEQLHVQAEFLKFNFIPWMQAHFELADSQQKFLEQLAPEALTFIADQTAFAVQNRLDIILEKDEKNKDEQGKIIITKNSLSVGADDQGEYKAMGTLTIQIDYPS